MRLSRRYKTYLLTRAPFIYAARLQLLAPVCAALIFGGAAAALSEHETAEAFASIFPVGGPLLLTAVWACGLLLKPPFPFSAPMNERSVRWRALALAGGFAAIFATGLVPAFLLEGIVERKEDFLRQLFIFGSTGICVILGRTLLTLSHINNRKMTLACALSMAPFALVWIGLSFHFVGVVIAGTISFFAFVFWVGKVKETTETWVKTLSVISLVSLWAGIWFVYVGISILIFIPFFVIGLIFGDIGGIVSIPVLLAAPVYAFLINHSLHRYGAENWLTLVSAPQK